MKNEHLKNWEISLLLALCVTLCASCWAGGRSAAIAGFMPDLVACAGCGCYTAPQMCFYPNEGTLYCADCSVDRKEIHIFSQVPIVFL